MSVGVWGHKHAAHITYHTPLSALCETESALCETVSVRDDGVALVALVAPAGGWLLATAHIITAIIGAGVLGLPYALSWLGE